MIASLSIVTALAAAQTAPAARDEAVDEIVILGRKLGDWRGTTKLKDGRYVCRTRKSSGDRDVDAIACGAMEHCMIEAKPALDALIASQPPGSRRATLTEPINKQLGACLQKTHETEVERLADRRAAAKME